MRTTNPQAVLERQMRPCHRPPSLSLPPRCRWRPRARFQNDGVDHFCLHRQVWALTRGGIEWRSPTPSGTIRQQSARRK